MSLGVHFQRARIVETVSEGNFWQGLRRAQTCVRRQWRAPSKRRPREISDGAPLR